MIRLIFLLGLMATAFAAPARAATTTIYVDSSHPAYPAFADAVNVTASLGAADGVGAFVPLGGFIAYETNSPFTNVDFNVEFLGVTGAGTLRLYVGQTNGGTGFSALNSAFFTITDGLNNLNSTALSNYCVTIGGCNTFVLQAWVGTTFSVDAVPGGNPEPKIWALMIIAFLGVAGRMKTLRRRGAFAAPAPAPSTALA